MVTYSVKGDYDSSLPNNSGHYNVGEFSFVGLSTDTKPTGTKDGLKIINGSTFVEMNTKTVFYYDEEHSLWV